MRAKTVLSYKLQEAKPSSIFCSPRKINPLTRLALEWLAGAGSLKWDGGALGIDDHDVRLVERWAC